MPSDLDRLAPADWYPDPQGTARLRWWDGTRWTDAFRDAAAQAVPDAAAPAQQAESAQEQRLEAGAATQTLRSRGHHRAPGELDDEPARPHTAQQHADPAIPPPSSSMPDVVPVSSVLPVPVIAPAASQSFSDLLDSAVATAEAEALPSRRNLRGSRQARVDSREAVEHDEPGAPEAQRESYRIPVSAPARAERTSTPPVWLIALMPIITPAVLVGIYLASVEFPIIVPSQLPWYTLYLAALGIVYLWTLMLAIADRRNLWNSGHEWPAKSGWALLGAPIYLVARTVTVRRETGRMATQLWVWLALTLIVAGGVAAVYLYRPELIPNEVLGWFSQPPPLLPIPLF